MLQRRTGRIHQLKSIERTGPTVVRAIPNSAPFHDCLSVSRHLKDLNKSCVISRLSPPSDTAFLSVNAPHTLDKVCSATGGDITVQREGRRLRNMAHQLFSIAPRKTMMRGPNTSTTSPEYYTDSDDSEANLLIPRASQADSVWSFVDTVRHVIYRSFSLLMIRLHSSSSMESFLYCCWIIGTCPPTWSSVLYMSCGRCIMAKLRQ